MHQSNFFFIYLSKKYPLPEVVSGPCLLTEYRPDLVSMLLNKIVPETMRFTLNFVLLIFIYIMFDIKTTWF